LVFFLKHCKEETMAYPETNEARRDRTPDRDPRAMDTTGSFNWAMVIGIVVAVLFVLFLLGSFSDDRTATNVPTENRTVETPNAPPAPPPAP
jgi:hypothetical protein